MYGRVSPGTPPVDKTDLKLQELLWPYLLSAGIKGVPPLSEFQNTQSYIMRPCITGRREGGERSLTIS
ncbi:hypothetical protein LEMLEM_LOCUS5300 [Lemmus lemmus]